MVSGRLALAVLVMAFAADTRSADIIRTTADRVEVRAAANGESSVLTTVAKGTLLEVRARENGWVRVFLPSMGQEGFVPAVLTSPIEGAAASTGPSAAPATPQPGEVAPVRAPDADTTKVLILKVADGIEHSGDVGGGSGTALAALVQQALTTRGLSPLISEHARLADGIKEAQELGYGRVVRATITEYEDNATAWSGKADSAALSLELFDLSSTLIGSAAQRKKGSMWAANSKEPTQWFPELVQSAMSKLFSGKAADAKR